MIFGQFRSNHEIGSSRGVTDALVLIDPWLSGSVPLLSGDRCQPAFEAIDVSLSLQSWRGLA